MLVGVPVVTLNPTALVTLLTVKLALPLVYTIVNGPAPVVDVYVNCPVAPDWIVLPLKLPCGRGVTLTIEDCELTTLHVVLTVT